MTTFDDLPLRRSGPPLNAWGLYGDDDELGRLNLITPETVKKGLEAAKTGKVVNLKYVVLAPGEWREIPRARLLRPSESECRSLPDDRDKLTRSLPLDYPRIHPSRDPLEHTM